MQTYENREGGGGREIMSMRTFINIYIFNFVPCPFSSSGEAGFTFGTF